MRKQTDPEKNTYLSTLSSDVRKKMEDLEKQMLSLFGSLSRGADWLRNQGYNEYEYNTLRRLLGKGGVTTPARWRNEHILADYHQQLEAILTKIESDKQHLPTQIAPKAIQLRPTGVSDLAGDYVAISASASLGTINLVPFQINQWGYVEGHYLNRARLYGVAGYDSKCLSILIYKQRKPGLALAPFYFHMLFKIDGRSTRRELHAIEEGVSSRQERYAQLPKAGYELLVKVDKAFTVFKEALTLSSAEELPLDVCVLEVKKRSRLEKEAATGNFKQIIQGIFDEKVLDTGGPVVVGKGPATKKIINIQRRLKSLSSKP